MTCMIRMIDENSFWNWRQHAKFIKEQKIKKTEKEKSDLLLPIGSEECCTSILHESRTLIYFCAKLLSRVSAITSWSVSTIARMSRSNALSPRLTKISRSVPTLSEFVFSAYFRSRQSTSHKHQINEKTQHPTN